MAPRRIARTSQRFKLMHWRRFYIKLAMVISLLFLLVSIGAIFILERKEIYKHQNEKLVSKIAFGSSTSYDYAPQPVWVHGIIPSNPDVWIWLGDMAYMDKPRVNCDAMPLHVQCNCQSDWLHQKHESCMAGNIEYASSRMEAQLSNPDYAQFLAFMCPGHRAKGLHPPPGWDPSVCPRRIFGTYDDHDYSWESGNKRLPSKDNLKQIFLDGIGELRTSLRRREGRGIQTKHSLNEGSADQKIDIFMLDERYYRDPLPCHIRKSFCEKVALPNPDHPKNAWCMDFLGENSSASSCCKLDDAIIQASGQHGQLKYMKHIYNNNSSFCEVLGQEQRLWLHDELEKSHASLKLVVSSSVVLGNPVKRSCEDMGSKVEGVDCPCTGDDWDCYRIAQAHFMHSLSTASGCVVLLTGDYHYSDIKVLRPGQHLISQHYDGITFSYPFYQVMASGLTTSTGQNFSCDVLRKDPVGLRDHPECDFVRGPSFGMIEVSWEKDVAKLQIRDGRTGNIKLESSLSLRGCRNNNMRANV